MSTRRSLTVAYVKMMVLFLNGYQEHIPIEIPALSREHGTPGGTW